MIKRKVLVVADDVEAAASIRRHLEKDGYRVFLARDGPEALNVVRFRRPDVLLMERSLLLSHGRDLEGMMQDEPRTPIVMLTANTAGEEGTPPVGIPVSDRVGKPVDPCEVLSRVRAALRRVGKAVPGRPEEMRCTDIVIDRRCHQVRVRGEAVHLTPIEFRLLEVLAGEPGRAFTRLELLDRVFGQDYQGLERTVDTHVKNLRKKIEPDPTEPTHVRTVYGVGYRFIED